MTISTDLSARRFSLPVIHSGIPFCPSISSNLGASKIVFKSQDVYSNFLNHLRTEWKTFEQNIEELQKRFLISNLKTGNFVSLVKVILLRHSELKDSVLSENSVFIWQVRTQVFF